MSIEFITTNKKSSTHIFEWAWTIPFLIRSFSAVELSRFVRTSVKRRCKSSLRAYLLNGTFSLFKISWRSATLNIASFFCEYMQRRAQNEVCDVHRNCKFRPKNVLNSKFTFNSSSSSVVSCARFLLFITQSNATTTNHLRALIQLNFDNFSQSRCRLKIAEI